MHSCTTHYLLHQCKQDICVDGPLMSLVQHNDSVFVEQRISQAFTHQRAIRHVPDLCSAAGAVVEANRVPHLRASKPNTQHVCRLSVHNLQYNKSEERREGEECVRTCSSRW